MWFIALFAVAVGFSLLVLQSLIKKVKQKHCPPKVDGWIPWMGCAMDFGKGPVEFVQEKKNQLGSIFTLYMAGKRNTFITETEDFEYFFNNKNVEFQAAFQSPVQHIASISKTSFLNNHTKIHDTIKGRLGLPRIGVISQQLSGEYTEQLDEFSSSCKNGDQNLHSIIQRVMYRASMNNLFGKNILWGNNEEMYMQVEKHFIAYDAEFEYGSQLPEMLLKDWSKSKQWMLKRLQKAIGTIVPLLKEKSDVDKTVFEMVIQNVNLNDAPNYSLLFLWASLANAIPIVFWVIAFVLNNEEVHKKVIREMEEELGEYVPGETMTNVELKKLRYLNACMMETIRLRSPGAIARKVVKDFYIRDTKIPAGDLLVMSPYLAHRNPKYFPEPDTFKPERWESVDLDKHRYPDGFVGFGGGRYRCPGRWFALMEMHLLLALVFRRYTMEPKSQLPIASLLHVVGTQPPSSPMLVNLHEKSATIK